MLSYESKCEDLHGHNWIVKMPKICSITKHLQIKFMMLWQNMWLTVWI